MVVKIMTSKNPYIIEVFPDTGGFLIESDEDGMTMDAKTENGVTTYSFGDWSDLKE